MDHRKTHAIKPGKHRIQRKGKKRIVEEDCEDLVRFLADLHRVAEGGGVDCLSYKYKR